MRLLRALSTAGLAGLSLLWGAASASAAGPDHNWSGFYVGAVASGGIYTVEQEDYWCWWACNAPTLQDWDASIGAQAGFNGQSGNFVYGIVGDFNTGFENSTTYTASAGNSSATFSAEWNYYATVRGRAGLAVGNALVFGTAGIAIADVDYTAVGTDTFLVDGYDCSSTNVHCAAVSKTSVGFAGSMGVGVPVADNVHLTFEYLYITLPDERDRYDQDEIDNPTDTDDYVSWTTSAHLARVALVWEFN